jgi:hypothetical protein
MQQVEDTLNEWFVKKAPYQLPENARQIIVRAAPWVNLILAVLLLWGAWITYHLLTLTDGLLNYSNSLSTAYGYGAVAPTTISPFLWLGLVLMVVEAVVLFIAFPALRARQKSGWNLLFYTGLLNVVYGLVIAVGGMDLGRLIMAVLSSLVGLYLLFQVRSYFMGANIKSPVAKTTVHPAEKK